jgi:hypothetical protein
MTWLVCRKAKGTAKSGAASAEEAGTEGTAADTADAATKPRKQPSKRKPKAAAAAGAGAAAAAAAAAAGEEGTAAAASAEQVAAAKPAAKRKPRATKRYAIAAGCQEKLLSTCLLRCPMHAATPVLMHIPLSKVLSSMLHSHRLPGCQHTSIWWLTILLAKARG